MRLDELAFVNFQLAGMLKHGIPLEGALRQLVATLRRGELKTELADLEAQLASGLPIREALAQSKLPDLYCRMVALGAQSDDLPGVLTLVADHYQRIDSIGARLKGLMVYPSIVVIASLALSFFLALFFRSFSRDLPQILGEAGSTLVVGQGMMLMIWLPVIAFGVTAILLFLAACVPAFRRWLRWHLPGFKETALAQMASAMRLMLDAGTSLTDALGLLAALEAKTPAGGDIVRWQKRLSEGYGRFEELAAGSQVVPPLFAWLVASADEDLAKGFGRAEEVYESRATYRVEMLLFAALPVSVVFLGVMLVSQAYPVMRLFVQFSTILDSLGQ